jgi:hypothetical protein
MRLSPAGTICSLWWMRNPFRYFNSSPEVIRLTVLMYVRYPLSLRQVEDLLFERGMARCGSRRRGPRGVCHEAAGSQGRAEGF